MMALLVPSIAGWLTRCVVLQYRWNAYKHFFKTIEDSEGGLDNFSQGALTFRCWRSLALLFGTHTNGSHGGPMVVHETCKYSKHIEGVHIGER